MQTYTVQSGDTLYGISKQFGVSVDEIKRLNNLTSNTITKGQTLKIPSNVTTIDYIVKKGDSLYSIAKKFGVTVDEIKSLNNLTSNNLSIGEQLMIKSTTGDEPVNPEEECIGTGYVEPQYIMYTVQKGDSLYTIARRYNTSVDNIKALNNLTNNNLSIGEQLKIKEVS